MRAARGIFLSLGAWTLATGCLPTDHPFVPFETLVPLELDDGWVISSPQAEGVDAAGLEALYEELHSDAEFWQMRSLLVLRHGRLIAESYFKDPRDALRLHPTWSCTKQVVGLLAGQAVAAGAIRSLDDPISEYLDEDVLANSEHGSVRLSDLLTMRSGIAFSDTEGDAGTILRNGHRGALQYILALPRWAEPGATFRYNSGDPHLVMAAIQGGLSRPAAEWADEVLFAPIGLTRYSWVEADSVPFGGWGISATPRGLARLGQLILNRGAWESEQVVDQSWIDAMLTPRVFDVAADPDGPRYDFGYLSWIRPDLQAYYMSGSGGQFVVIIPSIDLMVVGTSEHDTDGALELGDREAFGIAERIVALVGFPPQ